MMTFNAEARDGASGLDVSGAAPADPIRLAVIAPHPVQYHTPLYRSICRHPGLDAKVIYLDTLGLEGVYDAEFRTKIVWDTPLLDGHQHEFVKNYAANNHSGFLARINPGLFRALRKGRYDAVLIQGYSTLSNWIALVAARLLGRKVIWRGEVTDRPGASAGIVRSVKDAVVATFFSQCDALMYTCAGNRQFLRRYMRSERRLFPFLCAVDNPHFRAEFTRHGPEIASIKRELDIPLGDLVVLYCGRLTHRKRIMDALEAVRIAGGHGLTFLIMGDGPLREEALSFGEEHGIRICHLGFVNQSKIGRYYTVADVFILLSEYDPSPKALNEAMNFDLVPIVSDRIGTSADLVQDGSTGFLVRLGDVETVAARIALLRAEPARRARMAKAAHERVAQFSFEANAGGLAAACQFALARSASPTTDMAV